MPAAGIATLLLDLLTPEEERNRANVFLFRKSDGFRRPVPPADLVDSPLKAYPIECVEGYSRTDRLLRRQIQAELE